MLEGVFSRLAEPTTRREGPGLRLPACVHLPTAYAAPIENAEMKTLVQTFKNIEPEAIWRQRPGLKAPNGEDLDDAYAHAMIVGPGGIEDRSDVWLGASILAPHVRYPDHDHPPAEIYLACSEGEFKQGQGEWFSPGIGGSFYNVPNINHAMRSGEQPLFAFWTLLSSRPS